MRTGWSTLLLVAMASAGANAEETKRLIADGKPIGVHLDVGEWYARRGHVEGRGVDNFLHARVAPASGDFRITARLRILEQRGSAASFFLGDSHFGFEGASDTLYLNGPLFGGLKLLGPPTDFFQRGAWFDFEIRGRVLDGAEAKTHEIRFLLDGKEAYRCTHDGPGFDRMGFSPWRAQMQIAAFSITGATRDFAPPENRGYTIPTLDLSGDRHRQIVVDREAGQYLGHPTTVLLEDGKTMLCVYPKGHGRGGIVFKRSADGGLTWSERLTTPKSWATSKEVPTIHRVVDAEGTKRLIMWSGLYPARLAVSEDDGATWGELEPVGDWGGIVVMGFVEKLSTPGRYLAMFHDDGRFFTSTSKRESPVRFKLFKTFSDDGGLTWSHPEMVQTDTRVHLCEPGCIRSPDGKRLAVLLRENARRRNSFVIFSDDEGATWTEPRELPAALTGDRHTGKYLPDGRLFISFRDRTHESPTKGDWVAWVGTFDDIVVGREGQYRVRLMDNTKGADCAYPGVEVLPDGTIVTTTYGHWTRGESPYIVSVRLRAEELDALARSRASPGAETPKRRPADESSSKSSSASSRRPVRNVLFISVDDLRPDLGCYGARQIHSPNIDRLASEGVVFDRAYCQFALCNPSRTSLLTGMRPDRVGVVGNHVHFRERHPDVVTLPQHFKRHGREARAIGKIYHGVFPTGASVQPADTMGDLPSWSSRPYRPGPRYYHTAAGIEQAKASYVRMYRVKDPAPEDWTSRLVFGPMTEAPDVDDAALYDGEVADRAVATLRELGERPFFLAVGFIKPHTPFVAPKRYWDLYDADGFTLASRASLPEGAPKLAGHGSGEVRRYTDQPKRGPFAVENQRRLRHGYAACTSYIDAQVGKVLAELERLGLRERTVVVLFGDHGWHLGEHGLWGKVTNFELAARVPLIISAPGIPGGTRTRSLTELLDLYPTLCELAGLPTPGHVDGESFVAVLERPEHAVKTVAFSQMTRGKTMGYSVRTADSRYTEWVDRQSGAVRARELYRYDRGLVEQENLAGREAMRPEMATLSTRLDTVRPARGGGDFSLARVFQDHMVLQRDMPIPVWGRAAAGDRVTVELAGTSATGSAASDGTWEVRLPARQASGEPLELIVRRGGDRIVLRDVLVGEVWLLAGQSNMEWPLSRSKAAATASARIRLLNLRGAARGGSGSYSRELIARLDVDAFCSGSWEVCSPESARPFSAVGYWLGASLEAELDVPVGLINVSIGGTPIEAWIRPDALAGAPDLRDVITGSWLDNEAIEAWCRTRARANLRRALEAGEAIPGDELGPNHSFKPGFMWQSAVRPLVPFALRGVAWYQGESNAESALHVARYGRLFELLVNDWRRQWGRNDLPLVFAQLPGMERPHWPAFRDVQRRTLDRVPGLGMAVTIDLGEQRDVHPRRKRPVGERLARCALATAYGRELGDATGPLIRSARAGDSGVALRFRSATTGLASADGEPPRHFELSGTDGIFHAARARIDGDRVILVSEQVEQPARVRHAWRPFPRPPVNLVNGHGLPASPFEVVIE